MSHSSRPVMPAVNRSDAALAFIRIQLVFNPVVRIEVCFPVRKVKSPSWAVERHIGKSFVRSGPRRPRRPHWAAVVLRPQSAYPAFPLRGKPAASFADGPFRPFPVNLIPALFYFKAYPLQMAAFFWCPHLFIPHSELLPRAGRLLLSAHQHI